MNPTADGSGRCVEDNAREEGGFAGGRYSPHRLWSNGGICITLHDPIELEDVVDKNRHPAG